MASRHYSPVLRQIQGLFSRGTLAGMGEGELLERFAVHRDEAAFETIVARHGPMVLAVCRRLLRDPHAVEDAFQATFLVLVNKAAGLRDGAALGPWLYGVAYRVAARARSGAVRRGIREQPLGEFEDLVEGRSPLRSDAVQATALNSARCSTRRSTGCRKSFVSPWSSAISRAGPTPIPPRSSVGPWRRSGGAWCRPGSGSAAGSCNTSSHRPPVSRRSGPCSGPPRRFCPTAWSRRPSRPRPAVRSPWTRRPSVPLPPAWPGPCSWPVCGP